MSKWGEELLAPSLQRSTDAGDLGDRAGRVVLAVVVAVSRLLEAEQASASPSVSLGLKAERLGELGGGDLSRRLSTSRGLSHE